MKRFIFIFALFLLIASGSAFDVPEQYEGGTNVSNGYRLDDVFSIYNISDDLPSQQGFWANEASQIQNLTIENHYAQYYLDDNKSHIVFNSGMDIIIINWQGDEITQDIKDIIISTPKSDLNKDIFYNILDDSLDVYGQDRISDLNQVSRFSYTTKQSPQINNQYLISYYNQINV